MKSRRVYGCPFGDGFHVPRQPNQVPRHLKSAVGDFECAGPVGSARVLRVDEFLEDIEVRRLDPHAQSMPQVSGKLSHLGNDPLEKIGCQNYCCWLRGFG